MKLFAFALSIVFLGAIALTDAASASRMNGKGNCSGGMCTGGGATSSSGANRASTTGKPTKMKSHH
jgi:hypothetical protein